MRICFWATTFQADSQALACHLAAQGQHEVLVVLDDPDRYRAQPVEQLLPFRGELADRRNKLRSWLRFVMFNPDVLIVDNKVPPYYLLYRPKRMLVLWHGYGWRVDHPAGMRRDMSRRMGDVTKPNPRFRWSAFGQPDREFTAGHRQIDDSNIRTLGSAYSDLLRPGSALRARFDPKDFADGYPGLDIVNRRTVLIGMTWHHGGLLGHWGEEWDLLGQLLDHLVERDVNVILRMHDRHRYEPAYLEEMTEFCARRSGVLLKFKSESPDSLIDVLVSDAMITNYSSFANIFYYLERPCVHIVPPEAGEGLSMRQWSKHGVSKAAVQNQDAFWKVAPEDVGGLRAASFEALLSAVDRSLDEPDCCVTIAREYLARHVESPDGKTCDRIQDLLEHWDPER